MGASCNLGDCCCRNVRIEKHTEPHDLQFWVVHRDTDRAGPSAAWDSPEEEGGGAVDESTDIAITAAILG